MNNNIDQEFVEYVVKSLVSKPDAVTLARRIDEKGVLLELTVDPEDLGRVIGKRGATAQSLRTLLRALGTKNDARYNLKIVDNGVGEHAHTDHESHEQPHAEHLDAEDLDHTTVAEDETISPSVPETPTSDRYSKTRQELEDLDDLDV
jgi:predicted RNA-binding protein YlqC (UPF0109 family)